MNLLTVLLQASAPGAGATPIFLMVGMFVVMYFFMIRPQAKRAKEQKKFAESMNSDENVVTSAGIHGRINRVNPDGTLQLEISRNVYVIIERSAISMEMTMSHRKKTAEPVVVTSSTSSTAIPQSSSVK